MTCERISNLKVNKKIYIIFSDEPWNKKLKIKFKKNLLHEKSYLGIQSTALPMREFLCLSIFLVYDVVVLG